MTTITIPIRTIGIRRAPFITPIYEDIIGILHKGDAADIETKRLYYDWTGKSFYRCTSAIGTGYIRSDIVDSVINNQGG